jgi:hypothetical protein
VPTLLAMLIASLVAWLVESPVRAMLGIGASMFVSFAVGTVAFFLAKQFVSDLRGGS